MGAVATFGSTLRLYATVQWPPHARACRSVNTVRKFEGKLDRHGLDARLYATVKLLDEKERSLRHARGYEPKNCFGALHAPPQKIAFSNVHLAAMKFADRTNLFAVGEKLRAWKVNGVA
jgi:hypothetical protein